MRKLKENVKECELSHDKHSQNEAPMSQNGSLQVVYFNLFINQSNNCHLFDWFFLECIRETVYYSSLIGHHLFCLH